MKRLRALVPILAVLTASCGEAPTQPMSQEEVPVEPVMQLGGESPSLAVENQPPSADAGGPYAGLVGEPVWFLWIGRDPERRPVTFAWGFGDGATGAGPMPPPFHVYMAPGTYTATLTVTDDLGSSASDTATVTIGSPGPPTNQPPVAVISLVPPGPDVNCTYLEGGNACINGGPSHDPDPEDDVSTLKFFFEYGDPAHSTWTQMGVVGQPPFVYKDNGEYTVNLTVTDRLGLSGHDTKKVPIGNVAPTVNPIAAGTIMSGDAFNVVAHFTDPGILDHPWNWTVDWGNGDPTGGSTSSQSAPITASHVYLVPGDYTVKVCVTDKDQGKGCMGTRVTVKRMGLHIDIKPGSWPNSIDVGTNGNGKGKSGQSDATIPVALLGSAQVDASKVDVASVRFGDRRPPSGDTPVALKNNGAYMASLEDVNADGFTDLVLHFDRAALLATGDLSATTVELWLTGKLTDGRWFIGKDAVRPVS